MSKTRILLARELKLEMNNKDIAEIRKQFKLDNDLLKIVVEEESTPTLDTDLPRQLAFLPGLAFPCLFSGLFQKPLGAL